MVAKGEEQEYSMYNQVKNAEYRRQQQEVQVKRLQSKLYDTRRINAIKLKEEMTVLVREEQDLEYKLQREHAQLAKVRSLKETVNEIPSLSQDNY